MNIDETTRLLQLIESYDRKPFAPGAIELWATALDTVTYQDAVAAVHQIFRINPRDERGNLRSLIPNDVLRPAQAIGEARRRKSAQRAIAAPPQRVGSTGRPAAVEALLAEARAKADAAISRYREPVAA